MWQAFSKINFFTLSGLGWGILLGGLSGTLIYPIIIGTLFAAGWGVGMGAALGLIIGILVAVSDALFLKHESDRQTYRRKLSAAIGTITAIGTVILLILTTNGIFWSDGIVYRGTPEETAVFFSPSLLAGVFWGALAAGYTASRYVDREYGTLPGDERIDSTWVIEKMIKGAANRWTFLLGTLAGTIFNVVQNTPYLLRAYTLPEAIGRLPLIAATGAAGGVLLTIVNILLLGLANGLLLMFANRLYFKEYVPHLTLEQYKARISVLVFLFTLVAGFLVSAFVFAPLSAVIMVMAARSYADWLYHGDEKLKRKAKEDYEAAARLRDNHVKDEETESVDDAVKISHKL